jgi:hypothetical protein
MIMKLKSRRRGPRGAVGLVKKRQHCRDGHRTLHLAPDHFLRSRSTNVALLSVCVCVCVCVSASFDGIFSLTKPMFRKHT